MSFERPDTPRPSTPTVLMEINLRTPSYLYNHGGYYAPQDPSLCEFPGGPCEYCQQRIDATCPSCDTEGTYVPHTQKTCNGCEDKVCTQCSHGARYFCTAVYPLLPISRQCSTEKWELAEEYLHQNPKETQTIADTIPGKHMYVVRRTDTGELVREHYTLKDGDKE